MLTDTFIGFIVCISGSS